MNKLKKVMTTLMLIFSLSGTVLEPVSILAETTQATSQTAESKKSVETKEVDESKSVKEKESTSISSERATNTKSDQEEKMGESQNANDSPIIGHKEEQAIREFLKKNDYELTENGAIISSNGSAYREDFLEITKEVSQLLGLKNQLGRATGQSIFVDDKYGSSTIGFTYSNGISELGWYAKKDASGGMLWCVEPGVPLNWGQNSPFSTSEVTHEKYVRASLAVYYGWEKQKSVVNAFYTEKLVQEITTGVKTTGIYDYNNVASQPGYDSFRKKVLDEVETFFNLPSFAGKSYTVKYGETLTLTDTNGSLSKYKVTSDTANVNVEQSGNTLKISAKSDSKESGSLRLRYQIDPSYSYATILYSADYLQDVIKAGISDPKAFNVDLKIEKSGHARVKKVDAETGKGLAGAVFRFTTSDGKTKDITTNAEGIGEWRELMVDTKVTLEEIKAPTGYVVNKTPQTITIRANETTTATFDNKAQLGTIVIDKSGSEFGKELPRNYSLKGNVFEIYAGTDTKGSLVDTITTDENGQAKSRNLPLGKYTLKEINASSGLILNATTFTVELSYAGQTIDATTVTQSVTNKEQKGTVVLKKRDLKTNEFTQGIATFEGATFDLFRKSDNEKLGTYTTDAKGQLTVNNLLIDSYYFMETKAPTGYVLDKTPVEFSIAYAGQTAAVAVQAEAIKKNQVITGGFDIIKTGNYNWYTNAWNWVSGKDSSGEPIVLKDVEFTVTQDFGKKEVVGKALTDKQGYVSFDGLPYGTYVVSETKTPTGYKGIKDFKVTISEHGQRFHYVVDNKVKEAQVKFVKVDEETGKEIVRDHAGFEIYSETTGEQLKLKDSEGKEQAVFYTNDEGVLQLPIQFAFGKYKAVEVVAPKGYVVADKPSYFEVTGAEKDGIVLVVITNKNQMGQLELLKTVETNVSVSAKESEYGEYSQFDFEQHAGVGFEFKIRPTEDIVTGDHTVRFPAGEFLQKDGEDLVWTTNTEGKFVTDPILYIGNYEILEVKAPKGVVLLDEPVPFSIDYAGQSVEITSSNLEVENFLQNINIYGQKDQEVVVDWKDDQAVIDVTAANNGQVFALRLAEELTIGETVLAADTTLGYKVVEDGIISFEGLKLPNQTIQMYLQEVDAGSAHVLNEEKYFFTYEPETNDQTHDIHVSAKQTESEEANLESEGEADQKAKKHSTEADADASAETEDEAKDPESEEVASDAILNQLARANVKVIKTDGMDQKALPGVEFELIRLGEFTKVESVDEADKESAKSTEATEESSEPTTDSTETTTSSSSTSESKEAEILPEESKEVEEVRTVIGKYVTNDQGEIVVEGLPTGEYLFVETKPLDWYHENDQEYAFDISAENNGETITIEAVNERLDLEVETFFAETETGSKVIDPTKDNKLTDYAWVQGGKEGHEYFVVTQYVNVQTEEVIDTVVSSFVSKGEAEQELLFDLSLPANTMKDGDELVATHMVYSDKDLTKVVNDHFDLSNKNQTVSFKEPSKPKKVVTQSIPQAGSYSAFEEFKANVARFLSTLFE